MGLSIINQQFLDTIILRHLHMEQHVWWSMLVVPKTSFSICKWITVFCLHCFVITTISILHFLQHMNTSPNKSGKLSEHALKTQIRLRIALLVTRQEFYWLISIRLSTDCYLILWKFEQIAIIGQWKEHYSLCSTHLNWVILAACFPAWWCSSQ